MLHIVDKHGYVPDGVEVMYYTGAYLANVPKSVHTIFYPPDWLDTTQLKNVVFSSLPLRFYQTYKKHKLTSLHITGNVNIPILMLKELTENIPYLFFTGRVLKVNKHLIVNGVFPFDQQYALTLYTSDVEKPLPLANPLKVYYTGVHPEQAQRNLKAKISRTQDIEVYLPYFKGFVPTDRFRPFPTFMTIA